MSAVIVITFLCALPAAKGKARQVALLGRAGEVGEVPRLAEGQLGRFDSSRPKSARRHSLRFLARHTNAVLAKKCLPPHRDGPRTWLQARTWHLRAHRAKRGTCLPPIPHKAQWLCIHSFEGSWTDTGDPHWGGLQMDRGFMATYGTDYIRRFHGLANRWPVWAQMAAAERAYRGVDWRGSTWPGPRYFTPWSTAGMCGL